jgi:hypothetical protein
VASVALKKVQLKPVDQTEKWAEMGAELHAAFEAKDPASFGKLFARQVKLAVAEALRGTK